MSNEQDRRVNPRVICVYPVKVFIKSTNDLISTKTIDISKGGTSFYLPKRFPDKTECLIEVRVVNLQKEEKYYIESMVQSSILDSQGFRCGIKFLQTSDYPKLMKIVEKRFNLK